MSRMRDSQWYGEGDEDLVDDTVTSSTSAAPGGRLAQLERYSKKQMLNAPQRFNQIPVSAEDSDLDSSEGEEEEQTNIASKTALKEKEKATAATTTTSSSTTTTATTTSSSSDNASMADVDDESKPKQPRKIQRFNKSYSDDEDEDAINEEDNKNSKERKVDKALRARNREVVHIAKLRQQGIDFEDDLEEEEDDDDDVQKIIENGEEEAEEEAGADGQMIQGSNSKQGYEEWKKTHMNRQVRADRVSRASTTQDKTNSANTMASKLTEEEERAERYKKMRALFDRKKDDKLMSFEEDDPLKPRKGPRRIPKEAEEEEEDEESKELDPWWAEQREMIKRKEAEAEAALGDGTSKQVALNSNSNSNSAHLAVDNTPPPFDPAQARLVLLQHMKPGETVLRAVKRLAPNSSNQTQAHPKIQTKMKNQRTKKMDDSTTSSSSSTSSSTTSTSSSSSGSGSTAAAFETVTEIAQGFLSAGYVEIYQDTYEKIQSIVQAQQQRQQQSMTAGQKRPVAIAESGDDEEEWVYKWTATDEKQHGPYESSKMVQWQKAGFFDDNVVARMVGTRDWISAKTANFNTTTTSVAASTSSSSSSTTSSTTSSSVRPSSSSSASPATASSEQPKKKFKF